MELGKHAFIWNASAAAISMENTMIWNFPVKLSFMFFYTDSNVERCGREAYLGNMRI